jgi:tetratricopeptide (TPR) repeat protein
VLDPGRVLDLEACLCRAQRRFEEALYLLDKAVEVSRTPERALINKGFTFEVMGNYRRAVEALQQAMPLVEGQGDRRLHNVLRFNLANNLCHLGQFREALQLAKQVRRHVIELNDKIDFIRILWLEGRITAGSGEPAEALKLLTEARRRFALEGMAYDAALVLLEESILLLDQRRTAEVKALAQELIGAFESQGVHREARVALQLFQEAAINESATSGLTRNILGYLLQARHDKTLRFTSS